MKATYIKTGKTNTSHIAAIREEAAKNIFDFAKANFSNEFAARKMELITNFSAYQETHKIAGIDYKAADLNKALNAIYNVETLETLTNEQIDALANLAQDENGFFSKVKPSFNEYLNTLMAQ